MRKGRRQAKPRRKIGRIPGHQESLAGSLPPLRKASTISVTLMAFALLLLRILVGDTAVGLQINTTDKLADCLGAHAALNAIVALKLGEAFSVGDEFMSLVA